MAYSFYIVFTRSLQFLYCFYAFVGWAEAVPVRAARYLRQCSTCCCFTGALAIIFWCSPLSACHTHSLKPSFYISHVNLILLEYPNVAKREYCHSSGYESYQIKFFISKYL